MTRSPWFAEFTRALWTVGAALAAGLISGLWVASFAVALAAYLGWHLYAIHQLELWLRRPKRSQMPQIGGIWGAIYSQLYRMRRQTRKRKRKLAAIIDRFKKASDATPDAAVTLGPDGEIEWLNEAAKRLLGLRSPQDIGHPIYDLLRSPDFRMYCSQGRFEDALEMASPLHEQIQLSLRLVPYREERTLLLARDVTRIRRLEKVRQDFVANVSHELRSPLTVIKGYVETLTDGEVPREWRRPLEEVSQQTERMCQIVEDLLQLSRIEHDPGGAVRENVPVAEMLDAICAEALRLCKGERDVRVEADAELHLLGDYDQLRSALSNLIFNAVSYTLPGNTIRVRWLGVNDGAYVEVEDTGVGIEPQHIERLTERFYRVDKARSRELGGTGLGLAIVKHILMRHDAYLHIESELGVGSTFRCEFPVSRLQHAPARVTPAATASA